MGGGFSSGGPPLKVGELGKLLHFPKLKTTIVWPPAYIKATGGHNVQIAKKRCFFPLG